MKAFVINQMTSYYFHANNMKEAKAIAADPLALKELHQQTETTIICENDGEEIQL